MRIRINRRWFRTSFAWLRKCGIRTISVIGLITFFFILIVLISLSSSEGSGKVVVQEGMTSIPMLIVRRDKCDACYGDTFCSNVLKGSIVMDIPHKATGMSSKGVYIGQWEGKTIVVKTGVTIDRFMTFDRCLCKTVFKVPDCDVPMAISNVSKIDIDVIRKLQSKVHGRPLYYSYCASTELLNQLSLRYARYTPNRATNFLFTSLVLNPEFAFLNYFTKYENWLFPDYYGSCGRISIVEHGGSPLETFLDNSFKERAEIASILLKSLMSLISDNHQWAIYYLDVNHENILYNEKSKMISFVDLNDIVVLRKFEESQREIEICNEKCMYKDIILSSLERHKCTTVGYQAENSIFASTCAQILTDSTEIRQKFGNKLFGETITKGLLHSASRDTYSKIHELIAECVYENHPNGRFQAVHKLINVLKNVVSSA